MTKKKQFCFVYTSNLRYEIRKHNKSLCRLMLYLQLRSYRNLELQTILENNITGSCCKICANRVHMMYLSILIPLTLRTLMFFAKLEIQSILPCLFVFYVPSTARSFREGTSIYCPLRRMCSSVNTSFPPRIEPGSSRDSPLRYC